MKKPKREGFDAKPEDCATAWFAVLERARLTNDYQRAAEAIRQLHRLGVQVKFPRRSKGGNRD